MKKLVLILALGLILGSTIPAQAITITATGTGDNWLWIWNSSWQQGPNFSNWQYADTLNFNVASLGQSIPLYIAVMNEKRTDTSNNPAAFLGEVTAPGGLWFQETGTDLIVSDTTHWQVAVVPYATWSVDAGSIPPENNPTTAPIFNPTTASLTWTTPTSYGLNGVSPWGSYPAIDSSAEWLWTNKNFNWDGQGQTNMDYLAVFRTTATVVPEPGTMMLLGMGILGLFSLRKRV